MKIFNKYIAIAMHVRRNYMDVLLQNISRIQGYPSLQPKLSLKIHFRVCFNNHVTLHVTHKINE